MKRKLGFRSKCRLLILPAAAGILLFYLVPFLKVLYYSFIKGQYQRKFVGLRNYVAVLQNEYFQLALKNTLLLIVLCVPVFVLLSFFMSLLYNGGGKIGRSLRKLSLYPFFLPSLSVAAGFILMFGSVDSPLPVYLMFLWKYVGVGILIVTAAVTAIEPELYQAARVDGAGRFRLHFHITLPLCVPALGYSLVLGIVYSFRTFRESYLYYGDHYPPEYSYTLQYYMNNQFLKLNYATMAAASVLMTLTILIGLLIGKRIIRTAGRIG